MTAGVNCVLQAVLNGSCHKRKVYETQAVPGHGESVSGADERGKYEQKEKKEFFTKRYYLPVILERTEKAVGNIVMKKYGKE